MTSWAGFVMDSLDVVNAKTRQSYNLAARRYHELFHREMDQKEYDRRILDGFEINREDLCDWEKEVEVPAS
jgi:hypothetical protein